MKVRITFSIEVDAVGRDMSEIQDEAIRKGTKLWLRLRDRMGEAAKLVEICPVPEGENS
jgi:hypothetical protein